MIKAYLTWIATPYEGEDMEIRYRIYEDEELIINKSNFVDYCKPVLCGLVSIEKLLNVLKNYKDQNVIIIINDGALYEILNETSMTKKREVQNKGAEIRGEIDLFSNLEIQNVSGNHIEMTKWNEILAP